jgi:precorrin-6B methylase 1
MLVVVGTGINGPAHLTQETRAWIERSEVVFYVVADAVTEKYILTLNKDATSLYHHYSEDCPRLDTYKAMTDTILAEVRLGKTVCAIFYGHPGVFVNPSHAAVRQARNEGFEARMLPAVSAEDCLVADLGLDPARHGCLTFEATDFLVYERPMDPASLLILWQVGVIGNLGYRPDFANPHLGVLCDKLLTVYPPEHEVIVYEASQFAICDPVIHRLPLGELRHAKLSAIATLAVPAAQQRYVNPDIMAALGIARALALPA